MVLRGKAARDMMRKLGIKPKNKMGAVSSKCQQYHFHASKVEALRCNGLHLMLRAEVISMLEVHPSIPLWAGRRYKADFRYIQDGLVIVEDVKGFDSRDWVMVKRAWPEYGRGLLRETRAQGERFFVKREIPGKWEK